MVPQAQPGDAGPTSGDQGGAIELAPGVRVRESDVEISYTRSSGPGGQNVNKLSTRCQLRVAVDSLTMDPFAKDRLATLAGRTLIEGGFLLIDAQEHRSQSRNREACFEKLRELIVRALVRPKPRRKTRPSKGSVERRLTAKKIRGQIKRDRRAE